MMQRILLAIGLCWLGSTTLPATAEEKLLDGVAKKMHAGQWGPAEQQLRRRVVDNPADDHARFALGFAQVIRTFERSAQFHYEHGARFGQAAFLFPADFKPNKSPNRISYRSWRREMELLHEDLAAAEATFAVIRDREVKFRVTAAKLQWDLDGDGEAQTWLPRQGDLTDQLKELAKDNPNIEIAFDYADVLWFRGYCNLLMGLLDMMLAADFEALFEAYGSQGYENPRFSDKGAERTESERQEQAWMSIMQLRLAEPDRWRLARGHFVQVTELSLQMWDAAEAEMDDDFEWLPNAKQKGALRIKVEAEMIEAWRAAMREGQAVLQGKKLIKPWQFAGRDRPADGKGINLRKLLDNPPEKVPLLAWVFNSPQEFIEEGPLYDEAVFNRVDSVFRGNTLGFSLWFN